MPRFKGKKQEIVERSLRGEAVQDVARAVPTSTAYVHNVRSEARGLGMVFPPPNPNPPREPVNTGAEVRGVAQTQPAATTQIPNDNPESRATSQDADVQARIAALERGRNRRQLLHKEQHLKDLEEEAQLQDLIADITPNPHALSTDERLYPLAMNRILFKQPWFDKLNAVADVHWTNGSKLHDMLTENFLYHVSSRVRSSSETPIKDLVDEFLVFAKEYEIATTLQPAW